MGSNGNIANVNKNIVLFLVENHDEVLEPLYRRIGSKKLPYEDMCMVHFDSHSDMSVPKNLHTSPDGSLSKYETFDLTSIESWIIPAIYSGHITTVAWLHPTWTEHSFSEENSFKVGRSKSSNSLKTTFENNYFLSEDSFDFETNLLDCKEFQLNVHSIDPKNESTISDAHDKLLNIVDQLKNVIGKHGNTFILDIDLDFFSTKDPFKCMFEPKQYEILRQVYKFTPPTSCSVEDLQNCISTRKKQLCYLQNYFSNITSGLNENAECGDNTSILLKELTQEIASTSADRDWEWIHEIGSGIDDCPLPDHISSEEEVDTLVSRVELILSYLPPPSVIFVARSSEDDYCPSDQVEVIQTKVLNMLDRTYKNIDKTLLYKN